MRGAKPSKIKELHVNFFCTPSSLDPRKSTDPVSNALHFMLYEGLMHLEADGRLSFAIAERVEISEDQTIYIFHLRNSVWSNGTPLTAYDFESSWKALLFPNFPSMTAHLLFPIKNAENAKRGLCHPNEIGIWASSPDTLVVQLEKPIPYFMELTAFTTFFPVPNKGREVERPTNNLRQLVTNGPFELTSWKNEDRISVRKNLRFWNKDTVKIDLLHMSITSSEETAFQLYKKGNLDWIGALISPLPLEAIPSLSQNKILKMRPIAGTTFCAFNTKKHPFTNSHIRKAFAYAINRQSIVENVTQMFDKVAMGLTPPVLKNGRATQFFPEGDAQVAKHHLKLGLEELGLEKGELPQLTYSYFSSDLQRKLALAVQSQWRKVLGLEVALECCELKVFLNKLHQRDFQFAQMSWIAQYFDQMSFLERFIKEDSFRNYSSWENGQYQRLIQNSFLATSSERRALLLEKAERLLLDEMPIAPLYHYNALYLENPRLKNAEISPLGHIDFRRAEIE